MEPDSTHNPNTPCQFFFLNVFPSSLIPDTFSNPWKLELENPIFHWGCQSLFHYRSVWLYYFGVDQMSANAEAQLGNNRVCMFFSRLGHTPENTQKEQKPQDIYQDVCIIGMP